MKTALLVSAFLMALVLSSCGGDGDGGSVLSPGGNDAPANVWLELLSHVPAQQEEELGFIMNDYARLREIQGVSQPDHDANDEELLAYLQGILNLEPDAPIHLTGIAPASILGTNVFPLAFENLRARFGFSLADVDQDLALLMEREFEVVRGRIDPGAVDAAVHGDATFGPYVEEQERDGRTYYIWGTDTPVTGQAPFNFDHSLAVEDGYAYWERTSDDTQPAPATGATLAGVERYRLLAEALGQYDLYAAGISDRTLSVSRMTDLMGGISDVTAEQRAAFAAELRDQGVLLPYESYAAGIGKDETGYYTVVIALHRDEATAAANVDRLRMRIENGATNSFSGLPWQQVMPSAEISSDGRLLTVMARTDGTSLWSRLLFLGDLLVHEDTDAP